MTRAGFFRRSWIASLAAALLPALHGPSVHAADGLQPVADSAFRIVDMPTIELGWLLYYDRILSGNRNVACATCHHPAFGTSDGVSLSFGDGGKGLGPERKPVDSDNRPEQRIGRNSPALFNLGAAEFEVLFHDGRLEADPSKKSGLRTPLDEDMVVGFDGVLSAQAMFPVLSGDEMAGHYSENDVAKAVRQGMMASKGGAWDIIARRVRAIPGYVERFQKIEPAIETSDDIAFTDIANVMADFIAFEFRADDSPFDRFLRGEGELSSEAASGMALFYGDAGCSRCHSGVFQTDHGFHAIAMPQIGPGKAARFETHRRDVGRMRVTGKNEDEFRFRTPSLRNVELTPPYGHAGAYATLEAVVRHHLDPIMSLETYDRSQAMLAEFPEADDWSILDDPDEIADIAAANDLTPTELDDADVDALIAFLKALTDPISRKGRLGIPSAVPSGLAVDHAPDG